MKILYLKLKNSIGIFAGMNKYSIEIDFNKAKNNIIMLFGGNGSGKSTILSALNPFVDTTNDERDKFFIEGKEGYKEIHYKDEDDVYIIKHYVSVKNKTKSFLGKISYKNYLKYFPNFNENAKYYTELNENGGVTTFKELIWKYLNVDEDFFKISRIGSNVTNFIDLSPANRKKFISAFLPNIDEYLKRYKIVNDKCRYFSKEIKYLSDELTKLGNVEEIDSDYKEKIAYLVILNEKNNKYIEDIAICNNTINTLDSQYNLNGSDKINPYNDEFEEINKQFIELEKLKDFDKKEIDESIEEHLEKLNKNITNKEVLINKISFSKEKISDINKIIGKLKADLSNIDKDKKHLDELYKTLKEYSVQIEVYTAQLNKINTDEIDFDRYNKLTNDELVKYSLNFAHFKEIITEFKNAEFSHLVKTIKSIYFDKTQTFEELQNNYNTGIKRLEALKDSITEDSNALAVLNENLKYKDILEQRPSACKINSCSFISEALKYKNIDKEIEELTKKINKNKKELEKHQKLLLMVESEIKIINNIKDYYNKNKEFFDQVPLKKLTSITNLKTFFKYILDLKLIDLNKISMQTILDYKNAKSEIENLKEKKKTISDSIVANKNIETMYNSISGNIISNQKDKEKLDEEYNKLCKEKDTIEETITKVNKILTKLKNLKENLLNYDKVKQKHDELRDKYNAANDALAKIREQKWKIKDFNDKKIETEKIIKNTNDALDNLKIKKSKIKEFEKRKIELDETFDVLECIKTALSPTKGIPIYFSKNYLNTTRDITNSLLDISQQGKFLIDFSINDKEFLINVYKNNGDKLDDIKLASQGETAMTSLSLSLALIEQSLSKYNIFLLDELDGALDEMNRRSFIDMVNLQMNKLHSEQVFIISHNNEFYSHPVDLILLKDNSINTDDKEFMINKNVIFSI